MLKLKFGNRHSPALAFTIVGPVRRGNRDRQLAAGDHQFEPVDAFRTVEPSGRLRSPFLQSVKLDTRGAKTSSSGLLRCAPCRKLSVAQISRL